MIITRSLCALHISAPEEERCVDKQKRQAGESGRKGRDTGLLHKV